MIPLPLNPPPAYDRDGRRFDLGPAHREALSVLPAYEAWRFCQRMRRDTFTPDLATFTDAAIFAIAPTLVTSWTPPIGPMPEPAPDLQRWVQQYQARLAQERWQRNR